MAVGFFAPEDDERPNGVYHIRHMNTTNSATQTPLQSPVSREYLVQAFCEALNRVSIAGSTSILPSPPPSPSCTHPTAHSSDVFFPRSNHSNIPPSTPSSIRMHDDYRTAQWSPRSSVSVPRRRFRLSSASDEEDGYPIDEDFDEHMRYMAARERLQEFSGRIPPRKKREQSTPKPQKKSRDPKLWPTVVTAVVLAVGCGFLVSR